MTCRFIVLFWTVCFATSVVGAASAQQDDDIVRLPGQGELRADYRENAGLERVGRLIPGGGLLLSFDANADGVVDPGEVTAGIEAAYRMADRNGDGGLSPFEQVNWAKQLPTRDPSLANPVRFDPNLDKRVSLEEFTSVIESFARDLASPETGLISVADLQDNATPRRIDPLAGSLARSDRRRRGQAAGS